MGGTVAMAKSNDGGIQQAAGLIRYSMKNLRMLGRYKGTSLLGLHSNGRTNLPSQSRRYWLDFRLF